MNPIVRLIPQHLTSHIQNKVKRLYYQVCHDNQQPLEPS